MFSAAQNILSSHENALPLQGAGLPSEVGKPLKLRAAPPAASPAVRVQIYALNAVSDRGLTRTISANRRNMLPLAGEVIRIQKYPCLFAT